MKLRTTRSQPSAAAMTGISVATGRRIERDPRPPSSREETRAYRTRSDPLEGLWDEEVVPMLAGAPALRPITILPELGRRHSDRISDGVHRTLERRIRTWRALHGPERTVMFPQTHMPGRMGLSDFTDMSALGVIVAGQLLEHRLYHFALVYSGFEHGEVVLGSITFGGRARARCYWRRQLAAEACRYALCRSGRSPARRSRSPQASCVHLGLSS